jgi:hypothetical protein
MTQDWKSAISRRPVLSGLIVALGLAIAGGITFEVPKLSRRRYKPGPYDDLLANLPDRENAARIGAAVIAESPAFDTNQTAQELSKNLAATSLADIMSADFTQGRMDEVRGWLLPQTLIQLCALAAKAA